MNRTSAQRLVRLLAVAGACVTNYCRGEASILVDDFTIAQSTVAFDSRAQISNVDDPRLFSGGRRLIAGVNNQMLEGDSGVAVEIGGGQLVFSSCESCVGTGTVLWPGVSGGPVFDTPIYQAIEFDVEGVTGEVEVRVLLQSTIRPLAFGEEFRVSEASTYQVLIPRDINLVGANVLSVGTSLGRGEAITVSSVRIVVPEPSAIVSLAVCCGLASCRKRHRQPGVVSR